MKKSQIILLAAMMYCISTPVSGQSRLIHGIVKGPTEDNDQKQVLPIQYANVYLLGSTKGVITNESGAFELRIPGNETGKLVVSFVGYQSDTILVKPGLSDIEVVLKPGTDLKEVIVVKRTGGSYISTIQPIKTEVITSAGLQKLACCNLAESFENSATVDVNYTDAISGAKQIQMLGLAGIYSQILMENVPFIRGLSTSYGLSHVPGPWMESIQISKGTSSVINGYESITGQINMEMKKPENSPPLFINLYGNDEGRLEANVNSSVKLNDKWSTLLLTHASIFDNKIDNNGDGFLDKPMSKQLNLMNRWDYKINNYHSQFGLQFMSDNQRGGQRAYYTEHTPGDSLYGTHVATNRYQVFAKNGFAFDRAATSLGIITCISGFSQDAGFGQYDYRARHESYYANIIFQSYMGDTRHTYTTGLSFMGDDYREQLNDLIFKRQEWVPGVFYQYTYADPDKVTFIVGLRGDYNSHYGYLFTPRMHIKYSLDKNTIVRASVGKGYRSSNQLADNLGFLATSRKLIFSDEDKIEQAWNYGLNFTHSILIDKNRKITLSLDLYQTRFVNQLLADADWSARELHFYNLGGKSYSTSLQAELMAQPMEGIEVTTAFRFNDSKALYHTGMLEKPLVPKYKGLLNVSWATRFEKWRIDLTGLINGMTRLPATSENPAQFRYPDHSPVYFILHAQLTRRFKHFELYLGGENLTGFMQKDPIIAANDPFGKYFDSSMIWGPITGRMIYLGVRYTIK